jgi:predicted transcriptional regulator
MDKYDYLILDIIQEHKETNNELIRLTSIEQRFWKKIEDDVTLSVGQAKIGERITNLYLRGYIQNRGGYSLTKRGREELQCQYV